MTYLVLTVKHTEGHRPVRQRGDGARHHEVQNFHGGKTDIVREFVAAGAP
jgi:hypothetical protein